MNGIVDDWIFRVHEQISIEAVVECFWPRAEATPSRAYPAAFKAVVILLVLVESRKQQESEDRHKDADQYACHGRRRLAGCKLTRWRWSRAFRGHARRIRRDDDRRSRRRIDRRFGRWTKRRRRRRIERRNNEAEIILDFIHGNAFVQRRIRRYPAIICDGRECSRKGSTARAVESTDQL